MKKIEVLCDIDHSNNNITLETLAKQNIDILALKMTKDVWILHYFKESIISSFPNKNLPMSG
jgi:hypothetical protein